MFQRVSFPLLALRTTGLPKSSGDSGRILWRRLPACDFMGDTARQAGSLPHIEQAGRLAGWKPAPRLKNGKKICICSLSSPDRYAQADSEEHRENPNDEVHHL